MTSLYFHSGSGNHGCEAIVRTLKDILQEDIELYSFNNWEDYKWELDKIGIDIKRHEELI